jgi:hypothetical protein
MSQSGAAAPRGSSAPRGSRAGWLGGRHAPAPLELVPPLFPCGRHRPEGCVASAGRSAQAHAGAVPCEAAPRVDKPQQPKVSSRIIRCCALTFLALPGMRTRRIGSAQVWGDDPRRPRAGLAFAEVTRADLRCTSSWVGSVSGRRSGATRNFAKPRLALLLTVLTASPSGLGI